MVLELDRNDVVNIEKIYSAILKNKSFLITSHQNLDGDAIGSELSLYFLLKKLNRAVDIINWDRVPPIYKFLPFVKKADIYNENNIKKNFDVVIVIDCGCLERIVGISKYIKDALIINIDHHFSNSNFGNINWVNPKFSATGEMIYFIIEKFGKFDKSIATCIYTAILTDTGRFTYKISKFTIDIIKNLIAYNIDPVYIGKKIYLEKPLKSIKLLSLSLNNLKFDYKNKICWMKVTQQLYETTKTDETYTEGFIDFLSEIKEAKVIFFNKGKKRWYKS